MKTSRLVFFVAVTFLASAGCSPVSEQPDLRTDERLWDLGGDSTSRSSSDHVVVLEVGQPEMMPAPLQCEAPALQWYPESWSFRKPMPDPDWQPLTKANKGKWLGSSGSQRALIWGHASFLSHDGISPVWANSDEPFEISLLLVNTLESLEEHRAFLTVMVNYEPVEATWTHWDDDRGGGSRSSYGSGIAFDLSSWGELVDLAIPAETFEKDGVYEVSVAMSVGRPNHKYFDVRKRIQFYHGGFDWFERPSFDCAGPTRPTEGELPSIGRIEVTALKYGLARARGQTTVEEIVEPVRASPGEVVEVEVAMLNLFGDEVGIPVAAVPTLEGEPIAAPFFYMVKESADREAIVATRRTFSVTMPDAPGTYDFNVPVWYWATLPSTNPFEDNLTPDLIGGGTNMIRFEVSL